MGETAIDDWAKGPRAALAGGTTTVIDFVIPSPGESLIAAFDKWSGWAKESVMDYGVRCRYDFTHSNHLLLLLFDVISVERRRRQP